MLIDRSHRGWFFGSLAFLAGTAALYYVYDHATPGGAKGDTWAGLAYGVVGSLFMVFAAVLGARKRMLTRRIGPVQWWLKGHLWLGFLSLPVILFHGAFAFGGLLTSVLMWLLIIVVVSGVLGAVLQHFLPRVLLGQLDHEATFEQLTRRLKNLEWKACQVVTGACGEITEAKPILAELQGYLDATPPWGPQHRLKEEKESAPMDDTGWFDHAYFAAQAPPPKKAAAAPAAKKAAAAKGKAAGKAAAGKAPAGKAAAAKGRGKGASAGGLTEGEKGELRSFYVTRVMPYLAKPQRPGSAARALANEASAELLFDAMRARLPDVHALLDQLESYCGVARQRVRQLRLHRVLHGWLLVHIPLSMALMVLMVVHIFAALRY